MADVELYRKLLVELEAMRRRMDEISAQLREAIDASTRPASACASPAAPAPRTGDGNAPSTRSSDLPEPPAIGSADPAEERWSPPAPSTAQDSAGGVLDILDLADELREIFLLIVRSGSISCEEIISRTGEDEAAAKIYLKTLFQQGYVSREKTVAGQVVYRPRLGRTRAKGGASDVLDRLGA
ncbi:MAG: hypothetical protein HY815_15980 [Candidatus Riflebacteria bacterium]|nr:hypothetical protein [Candidatus Riflebacteria bacterium]